MKKFIFSLLTIPLALSAAADSGTLDFTYAEGELASYGKGKKEVIDVAMKIDDPSLAGLKLKSIKAYINTVEGIENPTLWLSSELQLQEKQNYADIASYEVTPSLTTVGDWELGLLEVTLEQPYVLTDQPLFVGYSITVEDNETTEQKNPIIYSKTVNPNGLFLHMSKSILKWTDYSESLGGVAFIVAELEGNFPDFSAGIVSAEEVYANDDESFSCEFMITNQGKYAINNIAYEYSFDDAQEVFEGYAELVPAIEPGINGVTPADLTFNGVTGIGRHYLKVRITEINGNENENQEEPFQSIVNVIPFVPQHRPLVEEYTGLWCGWCPGGYLAMGMIEEQYGDNQVSICYHNDDPMAVTKEYAVDIEGFPSSTIDRTAIVDPYYGSSYNNQFGIATNVDEAMNQLAIADVEVSASLSGDMVEVNSTVTFIKDIDNADYETGYVLIADGLTSPEWGQSNYYSGVRGYEGTPLEVLTEWPPIVLGLVFNDVAIDVSAMMGVEGSLPTDIVTAQEIKGNYSFNIADNELVQNRDNLKVAAYVIEKSTGYIVNANCCSIIPAGVNRIETDKETVRKEFYDLTGRRIENPSTGIFILKEFKSDGSSKTSKIIL